MNKLMFYNHMVSNLSLSLSLSLSLFFQLFFLKPSSLTSPVDMATFDPAMDISPMSDIATAIKLRRLQRKAKHILFNWLDHYRLSLGQLQNSLCCCTHLFPSLRLPEDQHLNASSFQGSRGGIWKP